MDILCGKMCCSLLLQQVAHLVSGGVLKDNGEIRFAELVNHRLLYGRGIIDCECTNIFWLHMASCQVIPLKYTRRDSV